MVIDPMEQLLRLTFFLVCFHEDYLGSYGCRIGDE